MSVDENPSSRPSSRLTRPWRTVGGAEQRAVGHGGLRRRRRHRGKDRLSAFDQPAMWAKIGAGGPS